MPSTPPKPPPNLRYSVRAIVLDEEDRILLCGCFTRGPQGMPLWVAPGGGVEPGEGLLDALRRELREEVGLEIGADPPHIWHQEVVWPELVPGFDGVLNEYFLVRTTGFQPDGALSADELAAEYIYGFRWWRLGEIREYRGPGLFSPRDLATPLAQLITAGAELPAEPVRLGV